MTDIERRYCLRRTVLWWLQLQWWAGVVAVLARTSTRTAAELAPESAKEVRYATPYAEIENEPPPKLIVDPPLPDLLAHALSIVWIQ